MFDRAILKDILSDYKRDFPVFQWKNERYKWEAIQLFQRNWDIHAENFPDMLKRSLDRTKNLLAATSFFPKGMIVGFAEKAPEEVRAAFMALYDQRRDAVERIEAFKAWADVMLEKYGEGAKQHYQAENAVSVYLWLRYPDACYIYKYGEAREAAKQLKADCAFRKGAYAANVRSCFAFYDELREALLGDAELVALFRSHLTEDCWPDWELYMLTADLAFYINRFYAARKKSADAEEKPVDVEELHSDARFKRWFMPVLDALVALGGYASRPRVHEKIIEMCGIAEEDLEVRHKSGGPVILNDIDWARNYLSYEGFLDGGAENGIWMLTDLGKRVLIPDELAGMIIAKWNKISAARRENRPVPEIDLTPYYRFRADEAPVNTAYDRDAFLREVFMDEAHYDTLVALLKHRKNVILQGAPGVGKTFAARRLAWSMMGEIDESRVELIQFHQNYAYEDFIMGYKPVGSGFRLTDGVFYEFCQRAERDRGRDYFFIIDEINRGNMSKIFGELLMLIEKDYRGTSARLAYTRQPFTVPENVYLIGMMNTADRSLAVIDYALRRRFSFYDMEPGFDTEGFRAYQRSLDDETFDRLIDCVRELNRAILKDPALGAGFRIGHSHFCNRAECTEEWMKAVVYYDILPTLREYWFDDPGKLGQWESRLCGVFDD